MHKGQRVVCTNDQFPAHIRAVYQNLPKRDVVYTIRDVYLGRNQLAPVKPGDGDGEVGLLLVEIRNQDAEARFSRGGLEPGFSSSRFAEPEEVPEKKSTEVESTVDDGVLAV